MFDVILIVLILILIGLIIFVNISKTPIFNVFGKEKKAKDKEFMSCRSPTPDFIAKANSSRSVPKQMPVQRNKNKNNKSAYFEYTVVSSNSAKSNEKKAYIERDFESNKTKTVLPKSLFSFKSKGQEQSKHSHSKENTQSKYEKTRSHSSSNKYNTRSLNNFEYTVVSPNLNNKNQNQKQQVFGRNENSNSNIDELPIFQQSEPVTNPCRNLYKKNINYYNNYHSRCVRDEFPYY